MVVGLRRVSHKVPNGFEHSFRDLLGILRGSCRKYLVHPLYPELLAIGIHRLGDAVRVEQNCVTRFELHGVAGILDIRSDPESDAAREREKLRASVRPNEHRRVVPAVRVGESAGLRIVD